MGQTNKYTIIIILVKQRYDQMVKSLSEKEKSMEKILNQINKSSTKLVQIGLLPTIPGLFTDSTNSGTRNGNSSAIGTTNSVNYKPTSLPTHLVSNNLQSLVHNMELFKTYLIQIENCKRELAKVENTIDCIGGQLDIRTADGEVAENLDTMNQRFNNFGSDETKLDNELNSVSSIQLLPFVVEVGLIQFQFRN